jgi:hypothetical protein
MDRDPHGIVPRRRLRTRGMPFERVGAHDDLNDDDAPDGNRSRDTDGEKDRSERNGVAPRRTSSSRVRIAVQP